MKLLFLLLLAGGVQAETRLYTDALGLPAGSSYQIGNTTFYTNSLNLPAGTRVDLGSAYLYNESIIIARETCWIEFHHWDKILKLSIFFIITSAF